MPSAINKIIKSSYAKMFFGVIIGIAGIAAGIKIGYTLIEPDVDPALLAPPNYVDRLPEEMRLAFDVGDPFPPESFVDSSGQTRPFSELFENQRTVLLFVQFGCGLCLDLLEYWDATVASDVGDDVQIVVCIDYNAATIPPEYRPHLSDKKIIRYDHELFSGYYGMSMMPATVEVGPDGIVGYVFVGFPKSLRRNLYNHFAGSSGHNN